MLGSHSELSALEKAYRDSVKNYRLLVRQGLDETLDAPADIARDLLSRTRILLDEKSLPGAKDTLARLTSHLATMKASFPTARHHLQSDQLSLIEFAEDLALPLLQNSGNGAGSSDQEISRNLEKARFSLQNEDWTQSRKFLYQAINRHLNKVQRRLDRKPLNNHGNHAAPDFLRALDALGTSSPACRTMPLENMAKLLQLSGQRGSNTFSQGIIASHATIGRLFSELSGSTIALASHEHDIAVLRLVIDRSNTFYILGIPSSPNTDIGSMGPLLEKLSSLHLEFDNTHYNKTMLEKLVINILSHISAGRVSSSGDSLTGDLSELPLDAASRVKNNGSSINAERLIELAKTIFTAEDSATH